MTSRRSPSRAAVDPGPPEHRVRAHERDVHPGVPGRGDVRPLRRAPVLVVPRGDQCAGPGQQVRVGVDLHAGHVGQRQPHPLGQLDGLPLVVQEHVRAVGVVRAVQADRQRAVAVVGDAPGAVVQVVAAPGVVRLPGRRAVLDDDLARGAGRPDGHRDVALGPGLRVQPEQVRARGPVVGRHGQGLTPDRLHRVGRVDHGRGALPVALDRPGLPQQPGPVAVVPAHPERAHLERAGRGGYVERDRLARQHAGLAGVAHDGHRRAEVPDLPVRVARQGVLTHLVVAGGLVRGGVRGRSGAGRRIG